MPQLAHLNQQLDVGRVSKGTCNAARVSVEWSTCNCAFAIMLIRSSQSLKGTTRCILFQFAYNKQSQVLLAVFFNLAATHLARDKSLRKQDTVLCVLRAFSSFFSLCA